MDTPRRGEIVTALAVVVLLAHLLFAQLTIVLSVALAAVGKVSRWRPQWLAVPAGAGLLWALAIGPAAALTGFTAGPRRVAAYLGGIDRYPGRLLHLSAAFTGLGQWLPRQLPLALILAAAEAAAARWLSWLHTDEQAAPPPRPGLIVAARRRYATAAVRSGGVVTRDGGALGIDQAAGGRAAISWRAAEGGVLAVGAADSGMAGSGMAGSGSLGSGAPGLGLPGSGQAGAGPIRPDQAGSGSPGAGSLRLGVAGSGSFGSGVSGAGSFGSGPPGPGASGLGASGLGPPGPGPAATSFQLVHAAIRRRKPVIAVDLTGAPWLAGSLAAVCGAADAPLYQFGEAGPASYEPLRGGDPVRAAALVTGMLDWTGATDHHRRACVAYLGDVFAVLAIAPGDPREPVLDDVRRLLSPAALRARLNRVPAYHPHASALAERVAASASLIEADPAALSALAVQLTALRASSIGRWLRGGSERISLGQVVRERAVGLFSLDTGVHGASATAIAGLVAFDAMALFAELRGIPVSGDGLIWLNGCETLDRAALGELVARGGQAGMTVLLTTTSEPAAVSLAGDVNVLAIHQLADPDAAGQLAALTGAGAAGSGPGPGAVAPAAPGTARSPGAAAPHAPSVVPDWARRMPAPAAGEPPAAAGTIGAAAGPAENHPFGMKGSRVVTADSLLHLREGAFTLVVKGPPGRILPRCQAVPASLPGRPA